MCMVSFIFTLKDRWFFEVMSPFSMVAFEHLFQQNSDQEEAQALGEASFLELPIFQSPCHGQQQSFCTKSSNMIPQNYGVNNLQGRWVSWVFSDVFFRCVFFEKRPSSRPEAKRLRSEDTAASPPTAAPEVVAVEEESLRRKAAADLYAQAWVVGNPVNSPVEVGSYW